MSSLEFRNANAWLEALARAELSAREAVATSIARIERLNPALDAVTATRFEAALAEAERADRARRHGEDAPLLGLPMTVKDTIDVAGLPTSAGHPGLEDAVAAADAPAVARLREAGAIVLGKTNVPLYAGDIQTANELWGTTRNPWAGDRTAGGSSGGAAAAVAAGLVPLELGSDLAGSVRIPAHCCGVSGLRPTAGLVPTLGHVTGPRRLDVERPLVAFGPIAREPCDLELALAVLAGQADPRSRPSHPALPPAERASLEGLRMAVWLDDPLCPVDAAVEAVLASACGRLAGAGVALDGEARPLEDAEATFDLFLRLMYATLAADLPAALVDRLGAGVDPEAPPGLPAALGRGLAMRHREWLLAEHERAAFRRRMEAFFERHALLVCPAAPTVAALHDTRDVGSRDVELGGRRWPYMQQTFWSALATLAGLPALVIPAGLSAEGLPVGLQLIGPPRADRTVLALGQSMLELLGGFAPPPGYAGRTGP